MPTGGTDAVSISTPTAPPQLAQARVWLHAAPAPAPSACSGRASAGEPSPTDNNRCRQRERKDRKVSFSMLRASVLVLTGRKQQLGRSQTESSGPADGAWRDERERMQE